MGNYKDTTDDELTARLDTLLARLDKNLKEIAPTLLAIAKDREEVSAILDETAKRGLTPGKDATPKVQ